MIKKLLLIPLLVLLPFFSGCSRQEFMMESLTLEQLQEKIKNDDSFVLLVERQDCPYCEALNEYIHQTSQEHPGIILYTLDVTDLELKKPTTEAKTLVSALPEGKAFLKLLPYYYYSPTMYRYEKGEPVLAGIGFNASTDETALWDVYSSCDLALAQGQSVWTFIEGKE